MTFPLQCNITVINALFFNSFTARWRHQMRTFFALLAICAGNSPAPGEFPAQRPVTRSFDVFFDLRLNSWINGWVNNREARDLMRYRTHYDVTVMIFLCVHVWGLNALKLIWTQTKKQNIYTYLTYAYVIHRDHLCTQTGACRPGSHYQDYDLGTRYIEAQTKWSPFYRRYWRVDFLDNYCILIKNSSGCNIHWVSNGSDNGLAPNRGHAIIYHEPAIIMFNHVINCNQWPRLVLIFLSP